jgi:hypothetical protein
VVAKQARHRARSGPFCEYCERGSDSHRAEGPARRRGWRRRRLRHRVREAPRDSQAVRRGRFAPAAPLHSPVDPDARGRPRARRGKDQLLADHNAKGGGDQGGVEPAAAGRHVLHPEALGAHGHNGTAGASGGTPRAGVSPDDWPAAAPVIPACPLLPQPGPSTLGLRQRRRGGRRCPRLPGPRSPSGPSGTLSSPGPRGTAGGGSVWGSVRRGRVRIAPRRMTNASMPFGGSSATCSGENKGHVGRSRGSC